jgi:hypothetical protein
VSMLAPLALRLDRMLEPIDVLLVEDVLVDVLLVEAVVAAVLVLLVALVVVMVPSSASRTTVPPKSL